MTASAVAPEILLARAYLSRVAEPANVAMWALVRSLGPVAAAAAIRDGSAPRAVLDATEARRGSVDPYADLDAAQRCGARLVVPESVDWPHFGLAALECTGAAILAADARGLSRRRADAGEPIPPLALWVRGAGELQSVGVRAAGFVGSRAATPYGEQIAAELAYGVARRGVVVVSGGAHGIDAAAHRAALSADGQTVLISAGGLDRPYPSGNAGLYERVADAGLLISESPPGCAPQRHRFLSRNRLIAALSTATVVVEAAHRSGAANTAAHCVTLGRPVMAVPGPVTSPMSAGCHALIRREHAPALLVSCVDDVLAVVGQIGDGLARADAAGRDPGKAATSEPSSSDAVRTVLDALDATSRRVFDGLTARRYARPEEIALRCGATTLDVIRSLPALDLAGLLESSDGGYRIAARVRTRSR